MVIEITQVRTAFKLFACRNLAKVELDIISRVTDSCNHLQDLLQGLVTSVSNFD